MPYYNAIISVPVNNSTVVVLDPTTGNYQEIGSEFEEYLVFLKQKKLTETGSFQTNYRAGIDDGTIDLSGYLVEPMFFPDFVRLPASFEARIKLGNGEWIDGELNIKVTIGSAVGADAITGQPIACTWKSR